MSKRAAIPFIMVPLGTFAPDGDPLSMPERLVLGVMLSERARSGDVVAVAVERLVNDAGVRRSTAQTALRSLEGRGILESVAPGGGRGRRAAYRIRLDVEKQPAPRAVSHPEKQPAEPRIKGPRPGPRIEERASAADAARRGRSGGGAAKAISADPFAAERAAGDVW